MDMTLETMWRRYRSLLDSELSFSNYRERFALLLSCEEHQMQLDIRNYDMEVSYSLLLLGQVGFQNKNFDVVVTESIFCYQNIFSFERHFSSLFPFKIAVSEKLILLKTFLLFLHL